MNVTIIGNGISANLGAMYLRRRLPESTKIVIVGPASRGKLPLVGESLIEISTKFLEEHLNLGAYMCKNHFPKYALTYYFKLDPKNPKDRTYSVHCNERDPRDRRPLPGWEGPGVRPPAWLLNRHVFDRDIQAMVTSDNNIERIKGVVKEIDFNKNSPHTLSINEANGNQRSLETNWVIDATGRTRFLGKRLNLIDRPKIGQRSCFWFWLTGFDRSLLKNVDALGPMPPGEGEEYHYDRYYTTHHFMSRGSWIWLIPIKTADNSERISIGITWRPDIFQHEIRSVDDFIEQVEKVHPVVTDLVKSGSVDGSHILRNYRYSLRQAYSKDRWCIIADAALAYDPLFSNGLAFCTIQLEQIGEMIAQDYKGHHSAEFISKLDKMFWAPVVASQKAITEWYESMDDPFLSALRLHWIEVSYFYILLPMVVNHCHYDPERIALWNIFQNREKPFDIPKRLLDLRNSVDIITPDHFVYRGKEKVNPRALEKVTDLREIRSQFVQGAELINQYKKDVTARFRLVGT